MPTCCSHSIPTVGNDLLSTAEKRRLALRLTLALSSAGLLVLALLVRVLFPAQAEVAELVAAAAAALVAGPVLAGAWGALRQPGMHGVTDLLVAAALVAAWVVGDLETAALVPLAMVVGHVLEERSLIGSREAIAALGKLTRSQARRLKPDGGEEAVPAERLAAGDRVVVLPGDRLPADGVVREGASALDTAPITGESLPVEVAVGDAVFAGAINQSGRLLVEVTRAGGDTTLGKVVRLMQEAESAKPPVTRLLERYALGYLALVLLGAAGLFLATGDIQATMALLVAACPCALVLAAPATAVASLAVAARHGILVKGTAFLEELAEVDSLVLDKTGTVTLGELRVVGVQVAAGDEAGMRRLAASLGAASGHPVSRACAATLPAGERLPLEEPREEGGRGVRARHGGAEALLGRPAWLAECGVAVPAAPAHDGPVVGLALGGAFQGWLLLADEPRPEARQALDELRSLGLARQVLLTGDRRAVADSVAKRLGIDQVDAEVLPEQKLKRVQGEIAAGRRPLVVGDGVNDALALKAGAVGVAMGAKGTDVALASSDLVLMTSDLRRLATSVRLSRRCRRTIAVNVGIGLGWTGLVIGCAAAGWIGAFGAALLHNVGTLAVMANAGRLLRFDETGARG